MSAVGNRATIRQNRPTPIDFEPTKVGFAIKRRDFNRPETEISITQQSHLDHKQVEQFRAIYVSSFPAPERGDFDELMDEIARGTRLLFAALAGNNLVGFAVTLRLKPTDIHALEYLAVEQASRNRGIGARLLRHAGETLKANSHASAIILEVEPDDEGAPEERRLGLGDTGRAEVQID